MSGLRIRWIVLAGVAAASVAAIAVDYALLDGSNGDDSRAANHNADGDSSGRDDGMDGGPPVTPDGLGTPRTATFEEALAQDAAEYAKQFGVSQEEAEQRLRWQLESGDLIEALREVAPERVSGIWLEHQPRWVLVIQFTGAREGLEEAYAIAESSSIPVEVRAGRNVTAEQLSAAQEAAGLALDWDQLGGTATDPRRGAVVIYVLEGSEYHRNAESLAAELEQSYGVPFRIEVGSRPVLNSGSDH